MNKPNIIDVTFIAKSDIKNDVSAPAKLDVSTGVVFDIASPPWDADQHEHNNEDLFIRFNGDAVDYPVWMQGDDYAVTNDILMERLARMSEVEVSGALMSRDAFERMFELERDANIAIPPELPVRIVATNEAIPAGDLYARFTADAQACIARRIHRLALSAALGEYMTDVDEDPESQLSALSNDDEEAIDALTDSGGSGGTPCELYESYSNVTLAEMIEAAAYSAKIDLESIANLSAKLSRRSGGQQHRALIVINGGIAEAVADHGVDVHVFDRDLFDTCDNREDYVIPSRFSDLVADFDGGDSLPVEGCEGAKNKKRSAKCRQ